MTKQQNSKKHPNNQSCRPSCPDCIKPDNISNQKQCNNSVLILAFDGWNSTRVSMMIELNYVHFIKVQIKQHQNLYLHLVYFTKMFFIWIESKNRVVRMNMRPDSQRQERENKKKRQQHYLTTNEIEFKSNSLLCGKAAGVVNSGFLSLFFLCCERWVSYSHFY
jgi:hypothetical protein